MDLVWIRGARAAASTSQKPVLGDPSRLPVTNLVMAGPGALLDYRPRYQPELGGVSLATAKLGLELLG